MSQNANFPKLRPGAPLSAVTGAGYHNAIRDVLRWAVAEMNRTGRGFDALSYDSCVVPIENNSGGNVGQYSVLGIDGCGVITPTSNLAEFQSRRLLSGVMPTSAHAGRFAILLDAIPAGQIGRAIVCGVAAVQVMRTAGDSQPDFVDIVASQTYLAAAQSGAEVLYCDPAPGSGSAAVWAYVRIPGPGSSGLTPFELYDDFTPGATDKYVWLLKDSGSGTLVRDTTTGSGTIKVSDQVLGDVRAYGSHHTGWSSTSGAKGFFVPGADGKNQIVSIRRLAKMIRITTPSGSGGYAANATISGITSVTVLDDGQNPLGDASSISVTNWNQATCNGVTCICVADGSGGYLVIDADCPPSGGCT